MAFNQIVDTDPHFGLSVPATWRGNPTPQLSGTIYYSQSGIENALNAADATYYTMARLANMTKNDKIYALRFVQDAASLV